MAGVTLTINGIETTVPNGTTILQAAEKLGFFIPTLCYDPELTRPGYCRICVVEVENVNSLPVSCATAVKDGMVVHTDSPAVIEARKTILELLLANHPEDCLTCGRTGDCRLQDYAYMYGVQRTGFTGEKRAYAIENENPFIVRDMNKCILCGKCIRMCAEIQGDNVIDFAYQGFHTKVATVNDTPLSESNCVFCGNCVSVCPVGALQEKGLRAAARAWEVEKVKTICPYCGTGCSLELNVKNNRVVGVTSSTEGGNGRALCVKGRFGYGFIHHPDRLKKPLVKKGGQFVESTWEEAIGLVAEKMGAIKREHGGDALAVLGSARCTTEDNYMLQKLTRVAFGTNNIDHCARL